MYSSEQSKWVAFQFKDPFAANEFLVCHVGREVCCRPNCDMGFQCYDKNDIIFVDTVEEATARGFKPCKYCLPDKQLDSKELGDSSFVSIDLNLLVQTVEYVNETIGFIKPMMNEDSEKGADIKETLCRTNNANLKKRLSNVFTGRNSVSSNMSDSDELPMTRNKFDHLKLIDLACRHIALAALSTSFSASILDDVSLTLPSPGSSFSNGKRSSVTIPQQPLRKKRRRGGVLGFKELASKSNLSPWHFHRVFKSVTGQTPKAYGDKCWEFINKHEIKNPNSHNRKNSIVINTRIANPTLAIDEANEAAEKQDNDKEQGTEHRSSSPHVLTPSPSAQADVKLAESSKKVKLEEPESSEPLLKTDFSFNSHSTPVFKQEELESPLADDRSVGSYVKDLSDAESSSSLFSIYENLVETAQQSNYLAQSSIQQQQQQTLQPQQQQPILADVPGQFQNFSQIMDPVEGTSSGTTMPAPFNIFDDIEGEFASNKPSDMGFGYKTAADLDPLTDSTYSYTPSLQYITNQQMQLQRQRQLEQSYVSMATDSEKLELFSDDEVPDLLSANGGQEDWSLMNHPQDGGVSQLGQFNGQSTHLTPISTASMDNFGALGGVDERFNTQLFKDEHCVSNFT